MGNTRGHTMKMTIAIAALAFAATTAANAADTLNYPLTENMARMCNWTAAGTTDMRTDARDICGQRILGTVSGVIAGERRMHGREICLPRYASPAEKIADVKKYFDEHPESGSADFGDVVAAALAQDYPCPRR
jgi:hypothetical protein